MQKPKTKRLFRKFILILCIAGILQNCLMVPREVLTRDLKNQKNPFPENTIFYVTFVQNPVLEDTEYIVDSGEKINMIEEEIRNCNCIKKFKVLPLTSVNGKEIKTIPYGSENSEYPNQIFLEFYTNQHSYQSLFNLFYFYDRDKKNKNSIFKSMSSNTKPLSSFQENINSVLKIQSLQVAQSQQEAKLFEKILKEAIKSNNSKSSKKGGGGGAALLILAIVTFIFTVTVHYAQTDVHLNTTHFQNNKFIEKNNFVYTLDTFSHLFLIFKIPWTLPQTHYNIAYKDLSSKFLNEFKKENLSLTSNDRVDID
ncbi:MAG TPA: hypothetical protein PK079_08115 [Leptospiraceae bacterium]|nr:hypothetical protein [Leptospiraceae bacterium]HMW06291.1 hypothetical protein [Leptospiraceae bacterium]HMX31030.1 hypothetical protein [Leptospiraceae bacterium]HMY32151.1 hypothetical protein [Leptospiraceae bacterium]HMZ66864.1 hypothetical protein [Leptospiraceae bacterium]